MLGPVIAANKKAGTSGAQFLKIGGGARATAMGNAFVAVGDDINSVYYNPAGISNLARSEFVAMHTEWIVGTNYDYGAFCYPLNGGAIAVSAATLRVEDLQRRSADETRGGDFQAMDSAYTLSYGHNLTPLISAGVTGRYINQTIDSYSAAAWDGDIGLIKRVEGRPHTLGIAAKHFGPKIQFQSESDPLPVQRGTRAPPPRFFNPRLAA